MDQPKKTGNPSFLLAQVGGHASSEFAKRLTVLNLAPSDVGILRLLGVSAGLSQQELSGKLGIHPSRLVAILDELERRGFVQRKPNEKDRRQYALHLASDGRTTLDDIGRIGREHGEALCAALNEDERRTLSELLQKIATQQGLTPGIHPGYKQMRPSTP